ncbi:PIG-L deacetylase family protein [Thermoanaerobacter sp. A7A]|uniref:PIG-L deacetylase family protein n=1 Tax=Thermoanaerobacter sp. A7A TaxID=1350366 RepID=UPI0004094F8A|nr:PIG-L deacetylase family protein [Thermoanaerobacter sp. A7A]
MNMRAFLNLPHILEVKSILCVQPHPDDNEIGAGGLLSILNDKGAKIVFATVTDGRRGLSGRDISHEEIIKIRHKEKEEAGRILGVSKYIDLLFEDGGDYSISELTENLVKIFRSIRPELVLTVDPWTPYEAHPDHQKTGKAVAAAMLAARNLSLPHLGESVTIEQIAFYSTPYPNTYIDITNYWERKIEAIRAHKSQFENHNWPLIYQLFYEQSKKWYKEGIEKGYFEAKDKNIEVQERLAETYKVLSIWELHMFPDAVFS